MFIPNGIASQASMLTQPTQQGGGLLDLFSQPGFQEQLMGLGQGLLASSGWTDRPVSMGEAWANGISGWNAAKQRVLDRALQQKREERADRQEKRADRRLENEEANTQYDREWKQDERDYTRNRNSVIDQRSAAEFNWQSQDRARSDATRQAVAQQMGVPADQVPDSLVDLYLKQQYDPSYKLGLDAQRAQIAAARDSLLTNQSRRRLVDEQIANAQVERQYLPYKNPMVKAQMEDAYEAQKALPGIIDQGQETITLIDELIEHPGLANAVGPIQGRLPSFMPETVDAEARIDQLGGKAFLAAFESLKGAGQITEKEGQEAKNAFARMNKAQDEATFVKALTEYRAVIQNGIDRARSKAGGRVYTPSTEDLLREAEALLGNSNGE